MHRRLASRCGCIGVADDARTTIHRGAIRAIIWVAVDLSAKAKPGEAAGIRGAGTRRDQATAIVGAVVVAETRTQVCAQDCDITVWGSSQPWEKSEINDSEAVDNGARQILSRSPSKPAIPIEQGRTAV